MKINISKQQLAFYPPMAISLVLGIFLFTFSVAHSLGCVVGYGYGYGCVGYGYGYGYGLKTSSASDQTSNFQQAAALTGGSSTARNQSNTQIPPSQAPPSAATQTQPVAQAAGGATQQANPTLSKANQLPRAGAEATQALAGTIAIFTGALYRKLRGEQDLLRAMIS